MRVKKKIAAGTERSLGGRHGNHPPWPPPLQMETVIKQSEEDRNKHLDGAKQMHHEYKPLKELVDRLRLEIGLAKLPELHEEDQAFKPEFFDKQKSEWHQSELTEAALPPSLAAAVQHMQQQPGAGRSRGALAERPQPSAFRQQPPPMKVRPSLCFLPFFFLFLI